MTDYRNLRDYCDWCAKHLERGWGRMTYHDSRFCSDECRTKYHNAKKKLKAQEKKMLEFVEFAQAMMLKGGELAAQAGIINDAIHSQASKRTGVKVHCKQCGQQIMWKPRIGERCSFCGDSNWQYEKKESVQS